MNNKITCTCGHSWDKSDSSKKDASVCHICGKNNMKDGGWLDKFDVLQAQRGIAVSDNTTVKKPIIQNPVGFANDPDVIKYNKVKNDPSWGEPYNFLMNWYSDPETKKRLNDQGAPARPMTEALSQKRYDSYLDWLFASKDKNRKTAETIWKDDYSRSKELSDLLNQGLDTKYDDLRDNTSGFHVSRDSSVALNSSIYPDKEKMYTTAVHELTHATPLDNFYVDYFKKNKPKNPSYSESQYFSENPTEIYPRIQDLRYQMWRDKKIAPGTRITPDMLDGYNNDSSENLRNYYSPEELSKIMNEIAYESNNKKPIRQAQNGIEGTMGGLTDKGFNYNGAWGGTMQFGGNLPGAVGSMYARTGAPSKGPRRNQTDVTDASAQNGQEMKFYQEGLDWKPRNISRDGSVTKDDNGYWNPENWGEPVEIGSNEITMQGVYEPLLGISDTGDTQMMYPGEDYTFDGESVTEYPVAQNGKKVKIPMSDFKKMGNNYVDSVNTYDYTQALWEAVNKGNSSEVDQAISRNKNLIKNTSNVKPTSYDNITVGGKNYRIPSYEYPKMDPWEKYEPVKGFWDNVDSKLSGISNAIDKTDIGKSIQKIDNKIDEGVKKVWRKFVDNDKEDDVQNQGATSLSVKKQSAPPKQSPPQSTKPKLENDSYIKKYPPIYLSNPKDPRINQYTEKGNQYLYKKPKQSVEYKKPQPKVETKKPESKKEEPVKKVEQLKPIERKQNIYEGSPVYSPGAGSGMGSALIGFLGQQGDTTYIKPEDYERFAVPKYGKEFIESKTKKKKNGGWLEKYN